MLYGENLIRVSDSPSTRLKNERLTAELRDVFALVMTRGRPSDYSADNAGRQECTSIEFDDCCSVMRCGANGTQKIAVKGLCHALPRPRNE